MVIGAPPPAGSKGPEEWDAARDLDVKEKAKGPVRSWLENSLKPIGKVSGVIIKDIGRIFKREPDLKHKWLNRFARVFAPVKWAALLGLAVVHTVTHLTGIAQLSLKISRLVLGMKSKWKIPLAVLTLPVLLFASLTNIPDVARASIFPSGSKTVSCLDPFDKARVSGDFKAFAKGLKSTNRCSEEKAFTLKVLDSESSKKISLEGHYFMPNQKAKATVLFQHGNAGCFQYDRNEIKNYLKRGYAVVVYNRRGCVGSEGSPTQATSVSDCKSMLKFTQKLTKNKAEEEKCDENKVVIHGHSLGGLIAAKALKRDPSFKDVKVILDRTGVNLRSGVENMVGQYASPLAFFAGDLLENFSDTTAFRNEESIDQLKDDNRLIVIKSAVKKGEDVLYGDEIFGKGEVAVAKEGSLKEVIENISEEDEDNPTPAHNSSLNEDVFNEIDNKLREMLK